MLVFFTHNFIKKHFLTTRGIPQIYYGTEVLMTHPDGEHGKIRADFPGGWEGDKINSFSGEGLTDAQKDMQQYISNINVPAKSAMIIELK